PTLSAVRRRGGRFAGAGTAVRELSGSLFSLTVALGGLTIPGDRGHRICAARQTIGFDVARGGRIEQRFRGSLGPGAHRVLGAVFGRFGFRAHAPEVADATLGVAETVRRVP